jgi:hypothetical protein
LKLKRKCFIILKVYDDFFTTTAKKASALITISQH